MGQMVPAAEADPPIEDEKPQTWTVVPNRRMRRDNMFFRGAIKPLRSRIRRRVTRIRYQKGDWQ